MIAELEPYFAVQMPSVLMWTQPFVETKQSMKSQNLPERTKRLWKCKTNNARKLIKLIDFAFFPFKDSKGNERGL